MFTIQPATPHFAFASAGVVSDSKSSAKITAGSLAMFLSPGYFAAIPISAGAVVGVALEVRNVITAENDTNLVRRMTANLTNESVQLKARHSTSQQTPYLAFFCPAIGIPAWLIIRPRQPSSTSGGT